MKKRLLAVSMSVLLLVSLLAGCGTQPTSTASATSAASSDAAVAASSSASASASADVQPGWKTNTKAGKLTWYVNADWWNTDYGNDTVTRKIKSDLNLDVEFSAGTDDVLNSLMASGTVPDIVTVFVGSSVIPQAQKWALPLNDLADQYDPYFYKAATKEVLDWYKLSDGKTYGYPSFYNTTEDFQSGYLYGGSVFVVRKDIYEAIGKPDMSTPEGFLNALSLAKKAYPKVTPLGFSDFGNTMGSLGTNLFELLGIPNEVDGKVNPGITKTDDADYQKWLSTINDAYTAGYIKDDSFSDTDQVNGEKIAKGSYFAMITGSMSQKQQFFSQNIVEDPNREYIPINGVSSTVGRKPIETNGGLSGWSVTYISKKCADPEKAIQMFTYLISDEGRLLTQFGVENETFTYDANHKANLLPEVADMQDKDPDQFYKKYRLTDFWFFMTDVSRFKYGTVIESPSIVKMQNWTKQYLLPTFTMEGIDPDAGTQQARDTETISQKQATTILSMVRSKNKDQMNKLYQDYITFRKANGFDAVMKMVDDKYQANKQRLGMN